MSATLPNKREAPLSSVTQMLENEKIMSQRGRHFDATKARGVDATQVLGAQKTKKNDQGGVVGKIHNVISEVSGKVKGLTEPVKVEEMNGGKRNKKRTTKSEQTKSVQTKSEQREQSVKTKSARLLKNELFTSLINSKNKNVFRIYLVFLLDFNRIFNIRFINTRFIFTHRKIKKGTNTTINRDINDLINI